MYILSRRAHLNSHWCAIVSKLTGTLVEPVVSLSRRLLIVYREDDEVALFGLIFVSALESVLTRRQIAKR